MVILLIFKGYYVGLCESLQCPDDTLMFINDLYYDPALLKTPSFKNPHKISNKQQKKKNNQ